MKKTDSQLQHDVMAELEWEPSVAHANIGVAVDHGVVTLSGHVRNYPEKAAAEAAARRVVGVKAIAEEIEIRFAHDSKNTDQEIARRIVDTLTWNVLVPSEKVKVKVEDGWVTLTGSLDWHYQASEARAAAGRVSGVVGVSNLIEVRKLPVAANIEQRIKEAIRRQADLDAAGITVQTKGSTAKLGGRVKTWNERRVAERTAWAAPGVTRVEDDIVIF